jgi:hypothetical protein
MLTNQWFVVATGDGHASVDTKTLPANREKKILTGTLSSVTVFHGPTVRVEDREDTFALAVGDTRSLCDLDGFRQSGPSRHAAICVIDKKTLAIRVLTDRVNFSKIFYSNSEAGLVLATHLTLLARKQLKLSINGLASVIANGTQFNNLTVYEDFRVLDRASIHEFAGGTHRETSYWQYGFESSIPRSAAKQQLKDALVDSIRDQICDRPILLSLSGGFDSSGILGVLAKYVKPQSINTFSYVFGDPKPNTDASVAKQMADLTGYPHETIQAWDGDILATFRRNAQLGQGLSNFCDEIDAWHRQAQLHAGSIVLAGDEASDGPTEDLCRWKMCWSQCVSGASSPSRL